MGFNDYLKAKAAKMRKKWAANDKPPNMHSWRRYASDIQSLYNQWRLLM